MNKFSHRLKGLNHHRETAHLCSNHPNPTNNPELCPDCLTHSANQTNTKSVQPGHIRQSVNGHHGRRYFIFMQRPNDALSSAF